MKWSQNFRQDDVEISAFDRRSGCRDARQPEEVPSPQFSPRLSRTDAARREQNMQRNATDPLISAMTFSSGVAAGEVYTNERQVLKSDKVKFSFRGRCTAKGTILIADDDEDIREVLDAIFSDSYWVLLTPNGFEALRVARDVRPSLFLLDYHMPGMDGVDLYDRLHAIKGMKGVPAIIMSAYLPKDAIGERQVAVVKKPFDCDKLLQVVEEVLISNPANQSTCVSKQLAS